MTPQDLTAAAGIVAMLLDCKHQQYEEIEQWGGGRFTRICPACGSSAEFFDHHRDTSDKWIRPWTRPVLLEILARNENAKDDLQRLLRTFAPGTRVRADLDIYDASTATQIREGTEGTVRTQDGPLVRVTWDRATSLMDERERGAVECRTLASNIEAVQ